MSKTKVHPLRRDAILTDENGRKWRIDYLLTENDLKYPVTDVIPLALHPDHTNCAPELPCKHYGEEYL